MIMIRCMAVLCWAALTSAARSDLTKLLSLSARNSEGAVVNVTSASLVLPSYSVRNSRSPQEFQKYSFRPRAIPEAKYKSEVLYPGNYFEIPQEKSEEEQAKEVYSQFQPQAIPLREEGRELDDEPEDFAEQAARRSLSYIFGGEAEEEPDDEDSEYEIDEEDTGQESKSKNKRKKHKKGLKNKRYSKYMLPLLLAYKMKYVAIVPVMIGGLVLLAGATGLAGFFFALFAATMALQKGGY